MKNKRGVSPLVATVLLIVIVIVIGLLIFFWYKDVLERQHEKQQIAGELVCAQRVSFQLSNIRCEYSDPTAAVYDTLTFTVANTGSQHIDNFNVILTGGVQSVVQVASGVRYPETASKGILVTDLHGATEVFNVEIIPMIIHKGQAVECSEKAEYAYDLTCS